MTPDSIDRAARLLADLRVRAAGCDRPLVELPEDCRPASLGEAYDIQDALRPLVAARGPGAPVGWKIGCTTAVMQQYLDIPHPCAGTLYRTGLHRERATLQAADFFQLGLECEIAVRLGAPIDARPRGHDAASVADAVAGVMASVEIVEPRFEDVTKVSTPSLVADDFFSVGCVLGQERPLERLGALADLSGGFARDGAAPDETGRGSAILGDPLTALAWLADHLAARDSRLEAGDVVTLGSVVKTIYPEPGARIEARFEGLPPVSLEIV